jgi:hypothetical protein
MGLQYNAAFSQRFSNLAAHCPAIAQASFGFQFAAVCPDFVIHSPTPHPHGPSLTTARSPGSLNDDNELVMRVADGFGRAGSEAGG